MTPSTRFSGGGGGTTTPRAASLVVAASNSIDNTGADYVCDGTADNVEIQAAIDALGDIGGKIQLLEGTYTLAADITLDDKIEIAGFGAGNTILDFANGAFGIVWGAISDACMRDLKIYRSADTSGCIAMTSSTRPRLIGVEIEAGTTVTVNGITASSLVDFWFDRCYIHGFTSATAYGINFGATTPGTVINCRFESNYRGIYLNNTSQSNIIGCRFSVQNAVDAYGMRIKDYGMVKHCHFTHGSRVALQLDGEQNQIIGNYFTGTGYGIQTIGAHDNVGIIHDNIFIGSDILLGVATKGLSIKNNGFGSNSTINLNNSETIDVEGNYSLNVSAPATTIENTRKILTAKNTSGGALAVGDVVTLKAVAAGNEVTTTTAQGDDLVFGMATEAADNDAYLRVLVQGKTVNLKVDGTTDIAVGDFLGTFTTAGVAMKAASGDMAFAIALEAYTSDDSAGVIDALLVTPRKI
ncbi:MAG: right-handed parallel beta-helix repeat-containing protein [Saprospiraceae bacterium]|nr:right-handed parallel beta-helix repeat-containing protein [Saprospiraceae bacterium]